MMPADGRWDLIQRLKGFCCNDGRVEHVNTLRAGCRVV